MTKIYLKSSIKFLERLLDEEAFGAEHRARIRAKQKELLAEYNRRTS